MSGRALCFVFALLLAAPACSGDDEADGNNGFDVTEDAAGDTEPSNNSSVNNNSSDTDIDGDDGEEPAHALEMGRFDFEAETFEPFSEGDEVEIIAGPQGGYHIWIGLQLAGPESMEGEQEAALRLIEPQSGEVAQQTSVLLGEVMWEESDAAFVAYQLRFILSINEPSEIADTNFELTGKLTVPGSGTLLGRDSVPVRIVNEEDEFPRGRGDIGFFDAGSGGPGGCGDAGLDGGC